jgi:hypothetical protein
VRTGAEIGTISGSSTQQDDLDMSQISETQQTEIEAAVFRRLLAHLDERKDVQNIDLMNLSGFCRNCLSKWYRAACEDAGIALDYEQARERVYGMPYDEWKSRYQQEASAEQLADFEKNKPADG